METSMVKQSGAFVSDKSIAMDDLGGGIRRKILGFGPELMIVRVWFEKRGRWRSARAPSQPVELRRKRQVRSLHRW